MNAIGLSIVWSTMQITLIGAITAALYFGARRVGPRLAATTAFCGLFMMALAIALTFIPLPCWPLGSTSTPRRHANVEGVPTSENASVQSEIETESASQWLALVDEMWLAELARSSTGEKHERSPAEAFKSTPIPWRWSAMFALVSIGSIAVGAIRLVAGLFAARRYSQNSVELSDRQLSETLDILRARLGCRTCVDFREHETLESAATIGWRRPTILLPRTWRDWDANELLAVLAHELAHIHHRDFSGWVCAQLFVAVQFFHPLAHWLAGRLRLEQELAADAVAAEITGSRTTYLTSLAELALHQDDAAAELERSSFSADPQKFLEENRNVT